MSESKRYKTIGRLEVRGRQRGQAGKGENQEGEKRETGKSRS
jgi:hypothetical protein